MNPLERITRLYGPATEYTGHAPKAKLLHSSGELRLQTVTTRMSNVTYPMELFTNKGLVRMITFWNAAPRFAKQRSELEAFLSEHNKKHAEAYFWKSTTGVYAMAVLIAGEDKVATRTNRVQREGLYVMNEQLGKTY